MFVVYLHICYISVCHHFIEGLYPSVRGLLKYKKNVFPNNYSLQPKGHSFILLTY